MLLIGKYIYDLLIYFISFYGAMLHWLTNCLAYLSLRYLQTPSDWTVWSYDVISSFIERAITFRCISEPNFLCPSKHKMHLASCLRLWQPWRETYFEGHLASASFFALARCIQHFSLDLCKWQPSRDIFFGGPLDKILV